MYINGVTISFRAYPEADKSDLINAKELDLPVSVMRTPNTERFINGDIAYLAIWDVVRTPQQILTSMQGKVSADEPGLVGIWQFDEGEGSVVHDLSVNNNHGEILGEFNWVNLEE